MDEDPCVLDDARFFDPTTGQWGYEVICESKSHTGPEKCPDERELFRKPPEQWWLDRAADRTRQQEKE